MGLGPVGVWEILVIVGVALLIFGPTQLPKIARGVGKAVRSFRDVKDEVTGIVRDDDAPEPKKRAPSRPAEVTSVSPEDASSEPRPPPESAPSPDEQPSDK